MIKKLGIVGGLSWISTVEYYKKINEEVNRIKGGNITAELLIASINEAELNFLSNNINWDYVNKVLIEHLGILANGGCEAAIIACNTAHIAFESSHRLLPLKLISIVDSVRKELLKIPPNKPIAIIGTENIIKAKLYNKIVLQIGLTEIPLDYRQIKLIEQLINVPNHHKSSCNQIEEFFEEIYQHGAEVIILGCTELSYFKELVIKDLTVIDSLSLHVADSVDYICGIS